ncbi:MAG: L,D-transpeptidase [Saprospiraceae bacterium]
MLRILLLTMSLLLSSNCADEKNTPVASTISEPVKELIANPLDSCQQLVLVLSPNDTNVIAKLRRYEKRAGQWKLLGEAHDVSLGRTGLAWGTGKHSLTEIQGNRKKEGDGKSPAGIFSFGVAFGYAAEMPNLKMPYVPITERIQCIEDSESKYYNRIVDNTQLTKDWQTADFMQRKDDLYEFGVFVNHNVTAQKEGGSCIFLHLWRGFGKPTAGCTAMEKENMLRLLQWLDPVQKPRLVQLVARDYPKFAEQYDLPKMD